MTFAALLSCAEKSQLWRLAQQLLQMAEETQVKLNTVAYNAVRQAHSVFECFGRNFGSWIVCKAGDFHSLSLIFYCSVLGMIWKSGFIML